MPSVASGLFFKGPHLPAAILFEEWPEWVQSTMNIVLVGVSHKTAPVGLRERLVIAPADLVKVTRSLAMTPGVREALILSTCNRVELVTCQ